MLKRCIFVCTRIMIRIYIYIYNDRTSDKYKDRIITFIRRSRRRNFMEIIFREKKKEGKEKEQPKGEHSLCPHLVSRQKFPYRGWGKGRRRFLILGNAHTTQRFNKQFPLLRRGALFE